MHAEPSSRGSPGVSTKLSRALPWFSGLILWPFLWAAVDLLRASSTVAAFATAAACLIAPLPGLFLLLHRLHQAEDRAGRAAEEAAKLKAQLETVRYRTAQLREELSAADRQARLSHQLTLLGQFTAGFMHEFNNPLSIVTSRLEILLEERKEDAALCLDLSQMLKNAQYMGNIAGTLLQALRRERGTEVYDPAVPAEAIDEVAGTMSPAAERKGVRLIREIADVPRVALPGHVISEVLRGLIANAVQALDGRGDGIVWVRLEPYHTAGSKVVLKVEDNGPGVPENLQPRLFEPFVSRGPGREHLGLGLFLSASLLNMYDGRLRYDTRPEGGARFIVEMPPARFVRGRPYHWFVGGESE
jgi:two-component system C4-dicarboxylate transport sensor histidine kinase DctB